MFDCQSHQPISHLHKSPTTNLSVSLPGLSMRVGVRRWHNHTPLEAGMVVSNEPGYYEDGAFGIRIENLLVIREQPTPHRFGGQAYLGFERLTLCPLQRKIIALEVRPPCP